MKNILFVVTYLDTGGIIRSLQNFLNVYDTSKYQVDVFAMVHHGVYKGVLTNCTVLPRNRMLEASVAHFENQQGWSKVESLLLKIMDKASKYRFQNYLLRCAGQALLKTKNYDAVIGFSEGLPTLFVSMMNHPNKIGWIHCDYANYLKVGDGKSELEVYNRVHSIVCVSEYTRQSFINVYPSLENRTYAIYNIIDDIMMRSKAKESIPDSMDEASFNIVTVGRLDPVKRISIVPEIARKVTDSGCDIRWYVIGPKGTNDEVARFNDNIAKYSVEGVVIPLGEKANPYPYIGNADLLVNTSVSEACPYVINEAKILGTPVVCTDFGSAKEFIEYGKNGYYEPVESLSERIIALIKDSDNQAKLKCNLASFNYDNQSILNKIYSLL